MIKNKLAYVLSAVLIVAGFASATVALAGRDEDRDDDKNKSMVGLLRGMDMRMDDHKKEAKLDGLNLEVSIKDNGQVLVRGAKVTAVSGNMISATTAWGAMNLNWNVNVLSSTNFVRKHGTTSSIAEVKVGDMISFTGKVTSGTSSAIVVDAKVIKNWSVTKQNVRSKIEGTVKSIAGTAAPTTLVLTKDSKDYTVNVATNTSIVNDDWVATTLSSFVVGNKVTAYGVVNDTTLSVVATVLRNESI
ncbi:MAG: hypothetical protein M3Q34_02095 [bacterium]|nr:hypothetical protein [bacterium]